MLASSDKFGIGRFPGASCEGAILLCEVSIPLNALRKFALQLLLVEITTRGKCGRSLFPDYISPVRSAGACRRSTLSHMHRRYAHSTLSRQPSHVPTFSTGFTFSRACTSCKGGPKRNGPGVSRSVMGQALPRPRAKIASPCLRLECSLTSCFRSTYERWNDCNPPISCKSVDLHVIGDRHVCGLIATSVLASGTLEGGMLFHLLSSLLGLFSGD